jgi:hypothetical protein
MTNDQDQYELYYANKLWNLLPAIYRALDTDQFNTNGPLRELVNRIGAQAATVRRGIDRMWEDQSIETCDDWVIPYIGDLLATNLVANLDAAGQRQDVAKTIYYRRRKGTLAILEEIAFDITGWNAKLVEFFRRLGRTRHGLDSAIGLASINDPDTATLQQAEGLIGPLTGTGIGGLADLRNVYGASKAGSAFDEFFHTADFRLGQGKVGWYGIPRLGVFLWRLQSFPVPQTTPVESSQCPGQFAFDPTGREIPLFAVSVTNFGDTWTSPAEWQLPTPISSSLLEPALAMDPPAYPLYSENDPNDNSVIPNALGVFRAAPGGYTLIPASDFTTDPAKLYSASFSVPAASMPRPTLFIDPTRGQLRDDADSARDHLRVTYAYGFSSTIGAGPYDRRPGRTAPPTPDPQVDRSGGGHRSLVGSNAVPSSGTLTLDDSLTYTAMDDVSVAGSLTFRAENEQRPIIRLAPAHGGWAHRRFKGEAGTAGNCLVLDGLFFSGADLVLAGDFDCVTLTCCTLDPGTAATPTIPAAPAPQSVFAVAADGRDLGPCRLWIEGEVGTLTIERCITGPIRTRMNGEVTTLTITDSIIQAIPTVGASWTSIPYSASIPQEPDDGASTASVPYSASIPEDSDDGASSASVPYSASIPEDSDDGASSVSVPYSASIPQDPDDGASSASVPDSASIPQEAADLALGLTNGEVVLSRCTVMGPVAVHQLQVSESILQGTVQVDDTQHGCVRFTAWTSGSLLPRQYESVEIAPGASLFTSTDFGQPGYGQLLPTVDAAILPASGPASPTAPTIAAGAQNGSEMGAFARDMNPIKVRGLQIKYQEYMPAGLVPVLIDVT